MNKKPTKPLMKKTISLTVLFYLIALIGITVLINACKKEQATIAEAINTEDYDMQETSLLTVAGMRDAGDGKHMEVMFYERAQVFNLDIEKDAATIARFKQALKTKEPLHTTTSPRNATITKVTEASTLELSAYRATVKGAIESSDKAVMHTITDINRLSPSVDRPDAIQLPATSPGLTTIIPDFATAKMMFDYFAQQSCNLPGPYGTDFCISFQYVRDGCYARAHKMNWVIANKYHYYAQKVFSYGSLSVRANKWGGCCVFWWYHVAPLVTVRTPTGPKSYVMDPGMFDQPVLLSTWLGAQGNLGCSPSAGVSSYSVQPTTAYAPSYSTDPFYASTDTTLVHYSHLKTCP